MTDPATDREIADMAAGSSNHSVVNNYPAICVDRLIARIRAEQSRVALKHAALASVMDCMEWDSMDGDTQAKVWEAYNERPHP